MNKELATNIILCEESFRCLVRGGVIHLSSPPIFDPENPRITLPLETISIALSDIGFHRMYDAIESAEKGIDTYKDHDKREIK